MIEIFGRINSVSKTVNAQEKRNSIFSGAFKQFCLNQAASRVDFWRAYNIFTANDIARMNEVQFVSDLVLNLMEGLSDFSQPKLAEFYEKFDDDFPAESEMASRLDRLFDFVVDLDVPVIRETIFNRQPIFFSLLLVLDSVKKLEKSRVGAALLEMDTRFHERDSHTTTADIEFSTASSSTTQRLRQRKIRHDYIRKFLG